MSLDLVPTRRLRAVPCAPPCNWCGQEGNQEALAGAMLVPTVTLRPDRAFARIGAWIALPAGVSALRCVVSGDALQSGLVEPHAVRLRRADRARGDLPNWTTASLSGTPTPDGRALVATLRLQSVGADGLERVHVLELSGVARVEGHETLMLRVIPDGGGCLVYRLDLQVREARVPSVLGCHVALEDSPAGVARALATWTDEVLSVLFTEVPGIDRLWLRGRRASRGAREGTVSLDAQGLHGETWRDVLRTLAEGGLLELTLGDRSEGCTVGLTATLAPRSRGARNEVCAWVDRSCLDPGSEARISSAMEHAVRRLGACVVQAAVGPRDRPVHPGAEIAWETSRG